MVDPLPAVPFDHHGLLLVGLVHPADPTAQTLLGDTAVTRSRFGGAIDLPNRIRDRHRPPVSAVPVARDLVSDYPNVAVADDRDIIQEVRRTYDLPPADTVPVEDHTRLHTPSP